MPTDRLIVCGAAARGRPPFADPAPLRLTLDGDRPNVRLRLLDLRREMVREVPPAFQDLLEIAAYVYAADQAVRRGGRADETGAGWRRRLFFRVPVRDPDLWASPAVHDRLVSVLSFLSEDEYGFAFDRRTNGRSFQQFLDFGTTPHTGRIDEVVMFSGGLDSLAGAAERIPDTSVRNNCGFTTGPTGESRHDLRGRVLKESH